MKTENYITPDCQTFRIKLHDQLMAASGSEEGLLDPDPEGSDDEHGSSLARPHSVWDEEDTTGNSYTL